MALVARSLGGKRLTCEMTSWEEQLRLLTTIPGIDRSAASTILIAETAQLLPPGVSLSVSGLCVGAWTLGIRGTTIVRRRGKPGRDIETYAHADMAEAYRN